MDILNRLIDLSVNHSGHLMVFLVVFLLLAGGVGLPLPEDVPLIFTGYLCHAQADAAARERMLALMLPLTFAAVVGTDSFIYFLGRRWGHHVPRLPILRRYLSESRLQRAQLAFHEHGGKTLFVARFLPGLRAPTFFTAGTFRIAYWRFLVFDGGAALISVPLLVLAGYEFFENLPRVRHLATEAQIAVGIGLLLLIGGVVTWKIMRHRRQTAAAKVVPPAAPIPPVPPAATPAPGPGRANP